MLGPLRGGPPWGCVSLRGGGGLTAPLFEGGFRRCRRRLSGLLGIGVVWWAACAARLAEGNLCSVNICQNGTCYEQGGFKICVCTPPFTGVFCDKTLSMCSDGCGIRASQGIECSSALCSLGNCVDTQESPFYRCECGDFFTGSNCETPNNPCTTPANNACGHGTCSFSAGKGSGVVTCECDDDWEPPPGASATKIRWGDSEVLQAPACTNRRTKGIAALPFSLSSGELILWWSVFALAVLALVWCCYSVLTESCGRAAKAWKLFSAARKTTA